MGIALLLPVFRAGEVHCDGEDHGTPAPLHEAVVGGDDGQLLRGLFCWHTKGVHGSSTSRRPCAGCVKTQINENTD